MNPATIIARKRDGEILSSDEIGELIRGYASGAVPDYQMSAWAMAVCLRGMTPDETVALTRAMLETGDMLAGDDIASRVDKHSTGGVGDKTSFIVAPLLACCGLRVPMISGRGLGATGGTLDKLESIAGVRTNLSREEFAGVITKVGCAIAGATLDLVPADRKLYALRDVTGTVSSIPLITASILSKKLAERLSALVLDVKFGSGAFMKSREQARALAESLATVASRLGLRATALLTAMDQPNGRMVGNAVEIDEALEILSGKGPDDLRELVLALAGEIVLMKSLARNAEEARALLLSHLDSGRALAKFAEMVAAQGGDLEAPRPRAPAWSLTAPRSGFVASMDAQQLGLAIIEMGGGRNRLDDTIDHSVGLEALVRLGDRVEQGQPLLTIFASTVARSRGLRVLEGCITIAEEPTSPEPLIAERISASSPDGTPARESTNQAPAVPDVGARVRQQLIDTALEVRRHAHAPYSKFRVGAALLTDTGRIYAGANIENASLGLTICAERAAFASAIAAGATRFAMLAVAAPGGMAPCGACRQFAAEFSRDLPVLLIDPERLSAPVEWRLDELLPAQFVFPRATSDQDAGNTGGHETRQRSS
jgi:homotetrameric cytidine deaminase